MTILQAIILGIVQGLTEFLPVSSTAHLLLTQYLLGWQIPEETAFIFVVLVQMGTLIALVAFFWKDLLSIFTGSVLYIIRRQPGTLPQARMGFFLILATIPALIAGVALKSQVERLFTNQALASIVRLLITAALLLIAERVGRRTRHLEDMIWKDALWVGCFQIFSVFFGASRSGSTITGGMTRHLDRPDAARFAFLMSVPVMLAAGLYETVDLLKIPGLTDLLLPVGIGLITSAIVGYLAIGWLLSFLSHRSLRVFAVYCLVLSLIISLLWIIRSI